MEVWAPHSLTGLLFMRFCNISIVRAQIDEHIDEHIHSSSSHILNLLIPSAFKITSSNLFRRLRNNAESTQCRHSKSSKMARKWTSLWEQAKKCSWNWWKSGLRRGDTIGGDKVVAEWQIYVEQIMISFFLAWASIEPRTNNRQNVEIVTLSILLSAWCGQNLIWCNYGACATVVVYNGFIWLNATDFVTILLRIFDCPYQGVACEKTLNCVSILNHTWASHFYTCQFWMSEIQRYKSDTHT